MNAARFNLDELVAHRPPMRLIDRAVAVMRDSATMEAVIGRDHPFFIAGQGVPAYTGLEMMAQAIASIDGLISRDEGKPPKIGFLLGCRRYTVDRSHFAEGDVLSISAKMVFSDGAMFSFECGIADENGSPVASGMLNVYAPADPHAFLRQHEI